ASVRAGLQHAGCHRQRVRRGDRGVPGRADGSRRAAVRLHHHRQRDRPRGGQPQREAKERFLMAVTGQQADLREPRSWRRTKNQLATVLMVAALVAVLIPLGFVLVIVIAKGASIISWTFLTSSIPFNVAPAGVGGMGPAVVGTLEIT